MRLALLACLLSLPAFAEAKLVAVLEFKNKVKGGEVDAGYLADVVRTAALDAAPGVRVMTRENMVVMLQSSGKKLEECEGECEVDTGRRLGADLVVSGEVLKFGSRFKLDLRMHETASGQLLAGAQASGKSLDELDDQIALAVKKLFAPLAAVQKPPPQAAQPQPQPEKHAAAAPPTPPAATDEPPAEAPAPIAVRSAAEVPLPPIDSASVASVLATDCGSDRTACFVMKQCRDDARQCFSLASAAQNGNFGLPKSAEVGVLLFEHGCAAGDMNGCVMAANLWWQGINDKQDKSRARQIAHHACLAGSASSCFSLRWSYDSDDTLKQECDEALGELCRKKNVDACWYAARQDPRAEWSSFAKSQLRRLCSDEKNTGACSYVKML